MAPLIVLALGFFVGTVIFFTVAAVRRRRKPQRMVDCSVCGRQIPAAKAVIVHGQITRDRDAYATTVAEYCKAHAPGPPRSLP